MGQETGIGIYVDPSRAKSGAREVNRALDGMKDRARTVVSGIRSGFDRLRNAFSAATAGVTAFFGAFVFRELVRVNSEFERMRGALQTLEGSQEAANKRFKELQEFAKTTPFTLDQSITAFIKLKNLGITPTEERLTSFGNTASAMGKDLNQFIEAVADASVFEFERLKEFGIKSRQETDAVALTFRGNTAKIAKDSESIIKYLEDIGNVEFAGAMEKQMQRLPGILSNLQDSFSRLAGAVGEGGFTKALGEAAKELGDFVTEFIDSGKAASIGSVLGSAFATASKSLQIFVDALAEVAKYYNALSSVAFVAGMMLDDANAPALAFTKQLTEVAKAMGETRRAQEELTGGQPENLQKEETKTSASTTESKATDEYKELLDSIRQEIDLNQRLAESIRQNEAVRGDGVLAIDAIIAAGKAEQAVAELGFKTDSEREQAKQKLTQAFIDQANAEKMVTQAEDSVKKKLELFRAENEYAKALLQERDDMQRLVDAKKQGVKAYEETRIAIEAENVARKFGLDLLSTEMSDIKRWMTEIEGLKKALDDPVLRTWDQGATDAINRYVTAARDGAKNAQDFFTNAARGMEDALTEFFTKGTLDFEAFAEQIVADINRIIVRQLIVSNVMNALGMGIQGGQLGFLGNLFGGGGQGAPMPTMAEGGITRRPSIISERGQAEAAVPLPNGRSIPVEIRGGGSTNINLTLNVNGAKDSRTLLDSTRQAAAMAGNMITRQLQRSRN
jgi:lambda family phage tail tape measure protein